MSGTTSVPVPTFGDNGFIAPAESAILAGVQADINAAFGGVLTSGLSTPQGQLASSEAAIIGDANSQLLALFAGFDPAYASGRQQDAIARIYFLTRNPAEPTAVEALCTGLPNANVVIPLGAVATATDGNQYLCQQAGTIDATGSVTLPFACAVTGPISCPTNSLTTITQTIPGWDTITNTAAGVLGNVVESRAAFETRRQQSVTLNAAGVLSAVEAAVLAVPGVLDAYVTENDTGSSVTIGSQTLVANSIYVCVSGGAPQAVANAIWSRKPPGCSYNGNTTLTVLDTQSGYNTPYPSYQVTFETPAATPILFAVSIANSSTVPSNALALIQGAIMAAFSGADGGTRARIGSTIYASRFYAGIAALGAWAQIIEIQLGTSSANAFSVLMPIYQVPTLVASNITLTLV